MERVGKRRINGYGIIRRVRESNEVEGPQFQYLTSLMKSSSFSISAIFFISIVPPATFPATAASTIGYATSAKQSDKSRSWGSIKKMNKWKWYQAHDNRTSDNRFYGGLAPFSPFYSIDFTSSWGLQPPRNRNALKRRGPFSWEKKHRRRKHKAKRWEYNLRRAIKFKAFETRKMTNNAFARSVGK